MKLCKVEGCDRIVKARELCSGHYTRVLYGNCDLSTPLASPPLWNLVDPMIMACPDKFLPEAAAIAEIDAQAIYKTLWRLLGDHVIPLEETA